MKYMDEYRDRDLVARVCDEIDRVSKGQPVKIMEVCGGHTHVIFKYGLEDVLPPNIEMVHGPGCPVCVLPMGRIDDAMALAQTPGVIFTTFADMMRVPGSQQSLIDIKAQGADVRFVYSPLDALKIAQQNSERQVIFFAIGFDTTTPSTAVTIARAQALGVHNFKVFTNHVMLIPALQALLDSPELDISGFLAPGHVSMVIGMNPYRFIAQTYEKPVVVAGFEPLDVLQSVLMVVRQLSQDIRQVENQYSRVVSPEGNMLAQQMIAKTMEPREEFEWRGLGTIPHSALRLRPEYAAFDAEAHFAIPGRHVPDHPACQCGSVLRGRIKPWECGVFGTACTPEKPIGTCMVSAEGACAAYYNYGRYSMAREREQLVHPLVKGDE
ncbi:MAG: hydrogenase formation protein HypD [Sulfobacillus thermotolerans]|uniref:Hydrogenase formation protein HypD n=1 Tax=Sulfobacillus thermotolerans TaxID=338644 RepID=A0ABN5H2J6_9FIRM|nr:hydrogenase formation protein HypD [Sulfobacillus thermotolerans]MCY0909038.1 hydrogenase formation protein HypD [Sulfobacillus thermotolerans]